MIRSCGGPSDDASASSWGVSVSTSRIHQQALVIYNAVYLRGPSKSSNLVMRSFHHTFTNENMSAHLLIMTPLQRAPSVLPHNHKVNPWLVARYLQGYENSTPTASVTHNGHICVHGWIIHVMASAIFFYFFAGLKNLWLFVEVPARVHWNVLLSHPASLNN